MQLAAPTEDEAIVALEQLKRTVRIAFCGVMQSTRLPPMAALSLAAMAVGSLYGEVAAAHRGDKRVLLRLGAAQACGRGGAANLARALGRRTPRRHPRPRGRRQRVRNALLARHAPSRRLESDRRGSLALWPALRRFHILFSRALFASTSSCRARSSACCGLSRIRISAMLPGKPGAKIGTVAATVSLSATAVANR